MLSGPLPGWLSNTGAGVTAKLSHVRWAWPANGLSLQATVKKHTNVLQHIMGYFKKELSAAEKAELLEVIASYHDRLVPLVAPLTLLKHYINKYDQTYLKQQLYLSPHPAELMLRNHV